MHLLQLSVRLVTLLSAKFANAFFFLLSFLPGGPAVVILLKRKIT